MKYIMLTLSLMIFCCSTPQVVTPVLTDTTIQSAYIILADATDKQEFTNIKSNLQLLGFQIVDSPQLATTIVIISDDLITFKTTACKTITTIDSTESFAQKIKTAFNL